MFSSTHTDDHYGISSSTLMFSVRVSSERREKQHQEDEENGGGGTVAGGGDVVEGE